MEEHKLNVENTHLQARIHSLMMIKYSLMEAKIL